MAYDPAEALAELRVLESALIAGVEPSEVDPSFNMSGIAKRILAVIDARPGAPPTPPTP